MKANIKNFRNIAKANETKTVNNIVVGDFLNLLCSGLKNDCGLVRQVAYTAESRYISICKVVEIMHVTEKQLINDDYLPTNEGGSESADIEETADVYNLTPEQIDSFYQLVTLVVSDSGRYVFVDRQGYNYNRYMYLDPGFETMFAAEIAQKKEEDRRREEEEERARIAYEAAQIAAARDRWGYCNPNKMFKYNLSAIIKKEMDITLNIKQRKGYFGPECTINASGLSDDIIYKLGDIKIGRAHV